MIIMFFRESKRNLSSEQETAGEQHTQVAKKSSVADGQKIPQVICT